MLQTHNSPRLPWVAPARRPGGIPSATKSLTPSATSPAAAAGQSLVGVGDIGCRGTKSDGNSRGYV